MKYLFLFSITPVQGFINQARKTQDLYAGSFILSHLCRTAAERAEQDYKARVIFPKLTNEAIINRFLAVVDSNDMSQHLQRLLKAAGQAAPESRPILEVNPHHALIERIKEAPDADFEQWAKLLLDQALLAEGATLEDPAAFVRRMNSLLLGRS